MELNLWTAYEHMVRSRMFEESIRTLWQAGLISGEMHTGTGEEAIVAGTVLQLQEGDAMALDHRGTAPLLMRGLDPNLLLKEFLGRDDGLCKGCGGHMHLFAPELLAASSGIVGSSGPAGAGFALAARYLRPGTLTLAFFGEGATNEGMMMETFNLAVVWNLPLVFICKDNDWSITTPSHTVTGSELCQRATGFGLPAVDVDGRDVEAVWTAAAEAYERARSGRGPTFMHCRCRHFDGHFLGYQLLRISRRPQGEVDTLAALIRGFGGRHGGNIPERIAGLRRVLATIWQSRKEPSKREDDPLLLCRAKLSADSGRLEAIEAGAMAEIEALLESVLQELQEEERT